MKLQNILLPQIGICSVEEMYFRREAGRDREVELIWEKNCLNFIRNGQITFDTYFNGLSVAKWKKYTEVCDISLKLLLQGDFEVTLLNIIREGHRHISHTIVASQIVHADQQEEFTFPYQLYKYKGMFTFKIRALSDGSTFYNGWYEGAVPQKKIQETNIAINICTFKREPYIMHNIDILNREIIQNPANPLKGHIQVYISDNGHTLPIAKMNTKEIHVVQNKNVGGAGGFTRGLMEIMKHMVDYPATHVLMMDDDIIISPEALYRTYAFLSARKEGYKDMFIGGAMLRIDEPNVQIESGASWNAGNLVSNKSKHDMTKLDDCLYNEEEEYTEFNAWWYCAMPMHLVGEDNLPLPIFIRGDDVEYGLRNMKTLVLMNGINVWHEAFENKYSSFLQYYIVRNLLYDNALHFPKYSLKEFLVRLYKTIAKEAICYRYKNIDLIFRGVNDFFKGVSFLENTDGEQLHKEIMKAGYKAVSVDQLDDVALSLPLYYESLTKKESKICRIFRFLTLNGYILPVKKHAGKKVQIVSMAQCRSINFFRQGKVLNYDETTGKGFVTERSILTTVHIAFRLVGMTLKVMVEFYPAKSQFKKNYTNVTKEGFWKKYLS